VARAALGDGYVAESNAFFLLSVVFDSRGHLTLR